MGFPVPFCILPSGYNFIYVLLLLLIFPLNYKQNFCLDFLGLYNIYIENYFVNKLTTEGGYKMVFKVVFEAIYI